MKKFISVFTVFILISLVFSSCSKKEPYIIAMPGDEASYKRAAGFLEGEGIVKTDGQGNITEMPENTKAAKVNDSGFLSALSETDFAVMSSDTAAAAGIEAKPLLQENDKNGRKNIIAVKDGLETSDITKVIVSVMQSREIKDFIKNTYGGRVKDIIINPGDCTASDVNYKRLEEKTISVACAPGPHEKILGEAARILGEKNIKLEIIKVNSYEDIITAENEKLPDAYYFPQSSFDGEMESCIEVAAVHSDVMGIYAGRTEDINIIKDKIK